MEGGYPVSGGVVWTVNLRHRALRVRVRISLLATGMLLLGFLAFDALPVDVDIPHVPDLEISYPMYVGFSTALVVFAGLLYSSWLLYQNSPRRIGLHREGMVLEYETHRSSLAQHLWTYAAPREVAWEDVLAIATSGSYTLSRHDVTLERKDGTPWVVIGISLDAGNAIREAFEAHSHVTSRGHWRGHAPVPIP